MDSDGFSEVVGKLRYVLIEISKHKPNEEELVQVIEHAEFNFERHWNASAFPNACNLQLTIPADLFTKNFSSLKDFGSIIKHRINSSSGLLVDELRLLPDYNSLQVINSKVFAVITEWQEINQLQHKLIGNLQTASEAVDFQNIGLISRTLMDKLSRQVFDPSRHIPKEPQVKVNNGMFKNQLHTYIDSVLSGDKNREFRKLAKSAIDVVEDSIDVMNLTTHKLYAEKHLAEVCAIGTISAISIIKLVKQLDQSIA